MKHFRNVQIYYFIYLLLILFDQKLQYFSPLANDSNKPQTLFNLNVAILSARENFAKRQSIRDSWFKHIHVLNQLARTHRVTFSINAHFVLGNQACLIHPLNREDLYSCCAINSSQSNSYELYKNISYSILELQTFDPVRLRVSKKCYQGFSFKTFHAISLKKIGALSNLIDRYGQINIVILNTFTKKRIYDISISNNNILSGNFYVSIAEIDIVSHGSYIVIIEQEIDFEDCNLQIHYGQFESILRLERSYYGSTDYDSKPFDQSEDSFLVNFEFQIKDKDTRTHQDHSKLWMQKMNILDKKLNDELLKFNDIVHVDLIDVYRNLPAKLLLYFQKYISFNSEVTHVLKTDDDCFVNILLIIELLLQKYQEKFSWFGNFRKKWPVNYYGKWADQTYSSPVYPQFACGSGYILTRDLVEWLNLNSNYLHQYQGEDVSLGIWMSSIVPKIIEDKRWICGEEQYVDYLHFFSAPQFTPEAMVRTYSLWNELLIRQT